MPAAGKGGRRQQPIGAAGVPGARTAGGTAAQAAEPWPWLGGALGHGAGLSRESPRHGRLAAAASLAPPALPGLGARLGDARALDEAPPAPQGLGCRRARARGRCPPHPRCAGQEYLGRLAVNGFSAPPTLRWAGPGPAGPDSRSRGYCQHWISGVGHNRRRAPRAGNAPGGLALGLKMR